MTTDLTLASEALNGSRPGPPAPTRATEILADRLFSSLLGTFDVLTVHIGDQFGLYELLHRSGPLSVVDVARRSGMHPRYTQEWLEQQAVAGLVEVEDAGAPANERRYALSDAHAAVLCDPESLAYLTPFARMLTAAAVHMPRLLESTEAVAAWAGATTAS